MNLQDQNNQSIAGIILAAGGAERMGVPKLLLSWKGETLIHRSVRVALEAGLNPVVVVTGAHSEQICAAINDLDVDLIFNPDWQSGQSTSVRVGIQALPERTQAVFFLLGDQPFVTKALIEKLAAEFIRTHPVILAPFVGNQRTNPVIFDHSIFPLLCQLQGDTGARSIFGKYPPAAMPWTDERILFDIDTPEDYQELIKMK